MQDIQVDSVGVVWLESNTVPVEFLGEVFRLEFVPFVSWWPILFEFLEPLRVKLLPLLRTSVQ